MNRLVRVRLSTQLRDRIENDIATGVFRQGERLDEARLAARFGVSRTPIREALVDLASSGLIEMLPRRGAFVRRVSVKELIEMFEVMAELEGLCGRLAARRVNDATRANLEAVHGACVAAAECGDPDRYYYENERFHRAIYAASQNAFLAEQAGRLHDRLKPFRRLQLRNPGRMEASIAEHTGVVDAIMAGDGPMAEARLRAHVAIQGERFTDFVASLDAGGTLSF